MFDWDAMASRKGRKTFQMEDVYWTELAMYRNGKIASETRGRLEEQMTPSEGG